MIGISWDAGHAARSGPTSRETKTEARCPILRDPFLVTRWGMQMKTTHCGTKKYVKTCLKTKALSLSIRRPVVFSSDLFNRDAGRLYTNIFYTHFLISAPSLFVVLGTEGLPGSATPSFTFVITTDYSRPPRWTAATSAFERGRSFSTHYWYLHWK